MMMIVLLGRRGRHQVPPQTLPPCPLPPPPLPHWHWQGWLYILSWKKSNFPTFSYFFLRNSLVLSLKPPVNLGSLNICRFGSWETEGLFVRIHTLADRLLDAQKRSIEIEKLEKYILGKKSVELEIEFGIPRSQLCRYSSLNINYRHPFSLQSC